MSEPDSTYTRPTGRPSGPVCCGHQALAEHLAGGGAHRLDVAGQLHAARLAAPAGVHLCLHDPHGAAERTGGRRGLAALAATLPGGTGIAVAAEQVLRLVFVQVHRCRAARGAKRAFSLEKARP